MPSRGIHASWLMLVMEVVLRGAAARLAATAPDRSGIAASCAVVHTRCGCDAHHPRRQTALRRRLRARAA